MFCMNILQNRHGQLFDVHSHIFFLSFSGHLLFLISGVKSASLHSSVLLFLRLYGTVLKEKILLLISGAKLFLTLNISYASVCKLH